MSDVYELAIREWIARRLRGRGHTRYEFKDVRNVRMGIDEGWPGTDITPGDEPVAAILCEIRSVPRGHPRWRSDKWQEHAETVFSVTDLIRECSQIMAER